MKEQDMENENEPNDAQLLSRFKDGDNSAFEVLLNRYRMPLFNYIYRLVNNKIVAEDLFQDVFVRLFKAIPNYQEQGKFSGWIFGIANNLAIDYLRAKGRQKSIFVDNEMANADFNIIDTFPDNSLTPQDFVERKELQQILADAISQLPVEQRQVLLMREHSDLPFKEIANNLGCSINTVLGRMRYALLNLRKIINDKFKGELSNVLQ